MLGAAMTDTIPRHLTLGGVLGTVRPSRSVRARAGTGLGASTVVRTLERAGKGAVRHVQL